MNDLIKILEKHVTVDDTTLDYVTCLCGEEWGIDTYIDPPREWAKHLVEKIADTPIQLGYSVQVVGNPQHGPLTRVSAHLINPKDHRRPGPFVGQADLLEQDATTLALSILSSMSMVVAQDPGDQR